MLFCSACIFSNLCLLTVNAAIAPLNLRNCSDYFNVISSVYDPKIFKVVNDYQYYDVPAGVSYVEVHLWVADEKSKLST